jgi:hypothetical protein
VRREFCTLFDSNYLTRAIAMHRSLLEHCPDFRLTAFCFDERAERLLAELALPNLETVSLAELEAHDPQLLSTKPDRTAVEYCWTATPALPRYMLDADPGIDEITYIDADLLFFADPEPIFEEMGDDSVLIVPHRYAPPYRHLEKLSGTYNVEWLTFKRDDRSLACLNWWHERCIEWCYFRYEDGKLGDQLYLNSFGGLFDGVHSLRHPGGGLAPWNARAYDVRRRGDRVMVDDDPLLFFHFHGLRWREGGRHTLFPSEYSMSRRAKQLLYDPYIRALDSALAEVQRLEPGFDGGLLERRPPREWIWELALKARSKLPART